MLTAAEWVQQMIYGQGAYPGQYMGGFGQSFGQAALGGMGLAGPSLFGGGGSSQGMAGTIMLPALIANMFAAPSTPIVGAATANLVGRSMMGLSAAGAFGNVQGGGGTLPGGFGLGPSAIAGITGGMEGMTGQGPRDLGMGDIARITQQAGQGGFFQSVTQVRQVRERLKQMVDTVKTLSQELTMTIDEVTSGMGAMRGMGYTTAGAAGTALRQVMRTAAASGLAPSEVMAYSAQQGEFARQAAHIPLALATAAARNTVGFVGAGVRAGLVSEESLMNAYGASGTEGSMRMSNRIQELGMRMMTRAPMQFSMAAMMDPTTGRLSQERMGQLLTGQMSPADIQRQAQQYIGSLGPGGYAQWLGQMPEMRGQFMAAGGGMAPIALAGAMMGQHGYAMDPNDPRSRAAFGRIVSRWTGTQVDPMEARSMMEMYQNMGNIAEAQQLAESRSRRQEGRAARVADLYASRDPAYMVNKFVSQHTERVTSYIERQAENVSARLERLTSGAAGMGFDVVLSSELYRGGRGVRALLAGGGGTTGERMDAMGFFRSTSMDVEGRQGVEAMRAAMGNLPTEQAREVARQRVTTAEGLVRATEAQQSFYTRGFMGERAVYEMAPEAVRRKYGGKVTAAEEALFKETAGGREGMITSFAGASDETKKRVSKLLGHGGYGVLDPSGFLESLASSDAGTASLVAAALAPTPTREQLMTGEWARTTAVTATEMQRAARASVAVQKKTGLAAGAAEYAYGTSIGERYKTEGIGGLTRAAREAATGAFGDRNAMRALSFIQSDPERAGQLFQALQHGLTGFAPGTTLGAYMERAGVSTAGMGRDVTGMRVQSEEQLRKAMALTGGAIDAQMAEEMRQVGWLSDTSTKSYQEALAGKKLRGGARTFAEAMIGAGKELREGRGTAAVEKAAGALVGLVQKGGGLEDAIRAGIVKDPEEARALARLVRGGRGEKGVTLEEFKGATGLESLTDISAATGIEVKKLEGMKLTEANQQFEMALARRAVTPGAGAAETPAGKSGDLAAQFGAILGQYGEGGALRVVVTNQPAAGGGDVQEPPVSGTAPGRSQYFG